MKEQIELKDKKEIIEKARDTIDGSHIEVSTAFVLIFLLEALLDIRDLLRRRI